MFEFVRANTRWLMGGLLSLLVVAFVAPTGYSSFMEASGASVASVDGHGITQAEWDAEHRKFTERQRERDPRVDPKVLDSDEAKMRSLQSLVDQRALAAAATGQLLVVDDARVKAMFDRDPQLSSSYRTPDGKLNTAILAAQGLTEQGFVQLLRKDIQMRQILAPVSVPAAPEQGGTKLGDLAHVALLQQREVRWQKFSADSFAAQVQVSDEDVAAYYKQADTQKRWLRPESADVEYLVLDANALKAKISVSDAELRQAYEANKSKYAAPEERRFAHILLRVDAKAGAAGEKAARDKLEGWRAEIVKSPQRFADLARQYSDDEASKAQGGDLGFNAKGAFPKAFDEAAFALKDGEVSPIVQTDDGLHLILARETRGGAVRAFDDVKAELQEELRSASARKQMQSLSEQFTNLVFEQATSLKPAAEKLGLSIQTATVARQPAMGATGVWASPKLLEAVFAPDAVRAKHNTEAIETAPNQLVSARVVTHRPAAAPPLETVSPLVRAELVQQRAAALAKAEGEKRLKDVSDAGLGEPKWVSRAQPEGLPREVLEAVLRADTNKLPNTFGQDAGRAGYWVVRLSAVDKPKEGVMSSQDMARLVAQNWLQAEGEAYVEALKRSVKASVKAKAPAKAASAS